MSPVTLEQHETFDVLQQLATLTDAQQARPTLDWPPARPGRLQVGLARVEAATKRAVDRPRADTVRWALNRVGEHEVPPGSNLGDKITAWQRHFTPNAAGYSWCGAFAGCAVEIAGGVNLTARILYTPYIYEDARLGRNGLRGVVYRDGRWGLDRDVAHSGDLVLYDFGSGGIKHVGVLRAPWRPGQDLLTVEGNTSPSTAGSQDNGGCVARKTRQAWQVHSIVSPAFAS